MYIVYADDQLLYSPNLVHEGYAISKPKVKQELNKAGSFSFLLPPNNVKYDDLVKLKTIITVYDDQEEIFRGRILYDEKDFYKRKQVYCEGHQAFLNDTILRPFSYTGSITDFLTMIINNHNSQVESAKQFTLGQVTVVDANNYINRSSKKHMSTWDVIEQKLIDTHGGYIRIRKGSGIYYLDYLESYNSVNTQTVEFGRNLIDLTEYVTAENLFTCLIPLGYEIDSDTGERLTIASVNSGVDYLQNQTAINLFGYVWKVQEWDDVTIASNLKTKGTAFLNQSIDMAVSLNINAVDLHLLDVNTESIKLGDSIRVVSVPHGLDRYFLCSKVNMNLQSPDETEFTLGLSFKTLTDQQLEILKKTN